MRNGRKVNGSPLSPRSMSLKSVYLPAASFQDNRIRIKDEEHHHLIVGRAETGESVEIFDGKGNVWTVEVESVSKRETVAVLKESRMVPPPSVQLILAIALIRTSAFELALEKAVEIGVTRIVPFTAARSNAAGSNRQDRWSRIVIEAAKQSKRYFLPAIEPATKLEQVLAIPASTKIMFAERDGGPLESALAGSPALYLIGPEGGWTDGEMDAARKHGFHAVSLGAGILKAETAAIVGGAIIRYELEEEKPEARSQKPE
jgi:16S rRNA (uracil1498-N3)-methyltransferase